MDDAVAARQRVPGADVVRECHFAELQLGGSGIPIPISPTRQPTEPVGDNLLGLEGEVGFELDQPRCGGCHALDCHRQMIGLVARRQLERVCPFHRTVRADIEVTASAELGRAEVHCHLADVAKVAGMIPHQFAPAVHPFVEIVVEEDARKRVLFARSGIDSEDAVIAGTGARHSGSARPSRSNHGRRDLLSLG